MDFECVKNIITNLDGKVGFYFNDLKGMSCGINENEKFIAASVIKIPVMIEVYKQIYKNKISLNDILKINLKDKVPSEGAAAYMHDGAEVTVNDLCNFMIMLSDNFATNILTNYVGMENINKTMDELGIKQTRMNRLLFDDEAEKRGLHNYITPKEIGMLLELMYKKELINESACSGMLDKLKLQQVNYKIPYLLPEDTVIAHKTGDDPGITHDCGIVYGKHPYIICFTSNETYVPDADDAIRKISKLIYDDIKMSS